MFRFSEALFVRGNNQFIVKPEDMDINIYRMRFKGYLYCPHPNCRAKLSFVKGEISRFFRTWRKDVHSEDCPYRLDYEEEVKRRKKLNPEYKSSISDEHINKVLKRAYKIEIEEYVPSSKISSKRVVENKAMEQTGEYGIPSLDDDADFKGERESNIYLRKIKDLTEIDNRQVRCVIGKVQSMYISDDYAYINYNLNETRVKIHFNEHFKSTNATQYMLLDYNKQYISENQNSICICVGEVVYVPSGIDVRPDRYNGFSINGLKLYEIVNRYISLV